MLSHYTFPAGVIKVRNVKLSLRLSTTPRRLTRDLEVVLRVIRLDISWRWSASRSGHCVPANRTLDTHWIRGRS